MAISPQQNSISRDYSSSTGTFQLHIQQGNRKRRACVADLVMEIARSSPEAIAISAGGHAMTFGDLAAQSMRMANYLIAHGARPEVPSSSVPGTLI
jgi:non-ribosomal peptide synthetase component F